MGLLDSETLIIVCLAASMRCMSATDRRTYEIVVANVALCTTKKNPLVKRISADVVHPLNKVVLVYDCHIKS